MNKKLLRKKLALMLATLKKKRRYYCEVEYLESTGTQYIDTGVIFSNSSHAYKWDIGAQAVNTSNTNYNWFCGIFEGGAYSAGTYADTTTNYKFYGVGTYYQNGQVITNPLTNGDKYGIIRNVFTITNFAGTLPVILFGRNVSSGIKSDATKRVFYYKIYDNDILVRDMIPVLDWDMTPCMYDKVSGKLFYNKGTGDFIAGRQIHQVEYLESTGTQYIDTGLYGTTQSQVDIVFGMTSVESGAANNAAIFGGRASQTVNTFTLFKIASATPQFFRFDYNGQRQVVNANQITWNNTSKYRFQYDSTKFITTNITTGESYSENIIPPTSITTDTICLFCVNTNGTKGTYFRGRINKYWYTDGTNSVDMFPAIDENGVGFMFDRVTHTIFDNAGTGAFQYPPVQLDYLESITNGNRIDTGLNYFADYEIGIKLRNNVANKALGNGTANCMERKNAIDHTWRFSSNGAYDSNIDILEYHVIKWKEDKIYADDVLQIEKEKAKGTARMTLFGAGSYFPNMIYFCKLWNPDDGVLMRDYIPVFYNGEAGMWDKVNNVFYPNAGTGEFVGGSVKEDEYE